MTDCPFCDRIAAGEFDYSDDHSVAFQPLNPVTPGHFLVMPRRHVTTALEPFAPIVLGGTMRLAAILARQMDLLDCNFINSAGPLATQTVFHLHVHVVPRRKSDGLHLPWTGQRERLVTVSREDLRAVLRSGSWGPDLIAAADRLAFAARYTAGEAAASRHGGAGPDMAPERAESPQGAPGSARPVSQDAETGSGDPGAAQGYLP